jgi:hypothetical protein
VFRTAKVGWSTLELLEVSRGKAPPSLEEVVALAKQLSSVDKLRLLEQVMPDLEATLRAAQKKPLRSSYGALADLGPAPSAEDIDEVRREMWKNFPRDDV